MAGDWIKMRMDLPEDPAVYRLARITGMDRLSVVGRLYAFWSWADKHAVDGRVDGASSLDLDDVVKFAGFADAMVQVGWLVIGADRLEIPKHDRHNGESAKERSLKNARQARWRDKNPPNVDAGKGATPSTEASTREEKRRNNKNNKQKPVVTTIPEDFTLTDELITYAAKKGFTDRVALEDFTEEFINSCKAKPYLYADFNCAWKNWFRKRDKPTGGPNGKTKQPREHKTPVERVQETFARLRASGENLDGGGADLRGEVGD